MKIKVIEKPYEEVLAIHPYAHVDPRMQGKFWRWLLKTVSAGELKKVHFACEKVGMEKLGASEPALILMNHSSFIDLKIASTVLYPRQFHIICTADGFVGKEGLMRAIGCIPTKKFVTDLTMIRDMDDALHKLKSDVLLFPEASYSFDGTATPLPESLGKALKILKVPVVMLRTYGAFSRDPLYNGLQLRDVPVTATMTYLLSPEEIAARTTAELNAILKEQFTFDNWAWQRDNHILIREPFRADGLHRVLYKCPHCLAEGQMLGEGTMLTCRACGSKWKLDELGHLVPETLSAANSYSDTQVSSDNAQSSQLKDDMQHFSDVPAWYAWERDMVRREIEAGTYHMAFPADILVLTDLKAVYRVGAGTFTHTCEGIHVTGCDGKLDFSLTPAKTYSLYADYYWYEIGDMISVGDTDRQYYCFPREGTAIVAKARLAAEELYKIHARKRGHTQALKKP